MATIHRRTGRARNAAGERAPVQSLSRALTLLEALAGNEGGCSLSDLAQQVGLPASTAHRLLRTLEGHRFAHLDPERGLWTIGVQAFTVGSAFLAERDVVAGARPFMHALMERSGESVNLGVLVDDEAVFLAQVLCREMMLMVVRPGKRAPVHASGVGKALLAALPESAVRRILHRRGLARFTANTLTSAARLREDLAAVRERGYAIDNEEHAVGLRCVAATVHDEHGEPLAAISISGPRARIGDERLAELGAQVVASADAICAALGGRPPPWRGSGDNARRATRTRR